MRPQSHCPSRPSLLKRKRTYSDDEDMDRPSPLHTTQSQTPSEVWGPLEATESEVLLSPESIPTSEIYSETGVVSDQLTPTDSEDNQAGQSTLIRPCLMYQSKSLSRMPLLTWADPIEVLNLMHKKDVISFQQREDDMFSKHPSLIPRMRSILLDWITEVCEVYKLHRETYHLCVDYIDRYLSCQRNIPKQQLQLIGVTCLFISSKVEEVYAPKLGEFAYVTDGACTEEEITDKELVILKTLNWNLSPVTAHTWLTTFLQIYSSMGYRAKGDKDQGKTFIFPQFSTKVFIRCSQLLDLCMLDDSYTKFSYGTLAAASFYHNSNHETALRVTGFQWDDLRPCVHWMKPFVDVLNEEVPLHSVSPPSSSEENCDGYGLQESVPHLIVDDRHNIQTHVVDMRILEKAQQRFQEMYAISESPISVNPGLLTPPASDKKTKTNFDS